jgi:hypothetical protein
VLAGKGFTRGADRVELVGLGAVATSRPLRAVDLDNPLFVLEEIGRQSGTETAGAFDGPHPPAGRVFAPEREHPAVPERVGGYLDVLVGSAVAVDHGQRVVIAMGIDPDHMIGVGGEHGQRFLLPVRSGFELASTVATARQDCDETRPWRAGRAPDQASDPMGQAGAGIASDGSKARARPSASGTFGSARDTGGKPGHTSSERRVHRRCRTACCDERTTRCTEQQMQTAGHPAGSVSLSSYLSDCSPRHPDRRAASSGAATMTLTVDAPIDRKGSQAA